MARLQSGAIAADKFNYEYLRFYGGRYGLAALERLKTSAEGKDAAVIRASAEAALRMSYPGEQVAAATTPEQRAVNIAVRRRKLPRLTDMRIGTKQTTMTNGAKMRGLEAGQLSDSATVESK